MKNTKTPREQSRKPKNLVKFFAESPLAKLKTDIKRKREFGRKGEL